jgi:hypothetical protein
LQFFSYTLSSRQTGTSTTITVNTCILYHVYISLVITGGVCTDTVIV